MNVRRVATYLALSLCLPLLVGGGCPVVSVHPLASKDTAIWDESLLGDYRIQRPTLSAEDEAKLKALKKTSPKKHKELMAILNRPLDVTIVRAKDTDLTDWYSVTGLVSASLLVDEEYSLKESRMRLVKLDTELYADLVDTRRDVILHRFFHVTKTDSTLSFAELDASWFEETEKKDPALAATVVHDEELNTSPILVADTPTLQKLIRRAFAEKGFTTDQAFLLQRKPAKATKGNKKPSPVADAAPAPTSAPTPSPQPTPGPTPAPTPPPPPAPK